MAMWNPWRGCKKCSDGCRRRIRQICRPLDYNWVLDTREQCIRKNVSFEFRQCGTHFVKDGKNINCRQKICALRQKKPALTLNVIAN